MSEFLKILDDMPFEDLEKLFRALLHLAYEKEETNIIKDAIMNKFHRYVKGIKEN